MSVKEMQNAILKSGDHSIVNELLNSGFEWDEAVTIAYMYIEK